MQRGRRNSSKYYWDELAYALNENRSICAYQHFPRRPRAAFVASLLDRLETWHPITTRLRCLAHGWHTSYAPHPTVLAAYMKQRRRWRLAQARASSSAGALGRTASEVPPTNHACVLTKCCDDVSATRVTNPETKLIIAGPIERTGRKSAVRTAVSVYRPRVGSFATRSHGSRPALGGELGGHTVRRAQLSAGCSA